MAAAMAMVTSQSPSLENIISSSSIGNPTDHHFDPSFVYHDDDHADIPVVDYSMLVSGDQDQRIRAIHVLGKACLDYGCFMVINHGVPEEAMKGVIEGCLSFFDMKEEEKSEYELKDPKDRIRWGKASSPHDHREFLKLISHPHFHCPSKPLGFREALKEYSKRTREVAIELLKGMSMALGLEESFIEKAMKLEKGFDICAANFYPPPQLGFPVNNSLPEHSDPGLLILIIQNVHGGLQLLRDGNWVTPNVLPNTIVANIGDHLEIMTNGKYKAGKHRVVMNNKVKRVSMPIAFGSSLDAFVTPLPEFGNPLGSYHQQTYEDFLNSNHNLTIEGKIVFKTA